MDHSLAHPFDNVATFAVMLPGLKDYAKVRSDREEKRHCGKKGHPTKKQRSR